MRCLQLVLWRRAMALGLMVAGVDSGYGLCAPRVCSGQWGAEWFNVATARGAVEVKCIGAPDHGVRVMLVRG